MTARKIRSIAVIGAGPAGAISTDALVKEQAFDRIRVFDRQNVAGGTWVYKPNLVHKIPSLRDLIDNRADLPVAIPKHLPAKVPRSASISSHQMRFSDTGVHDGLHSNLPPSTMSFTQEPLPETLSPQTQERYGPGAPFRHWSLIREYIEQIFVRGGHDQLCEFNTTVERAEKRDDGKWVLTLRKELQDEEADYWWTEEFDAVVIASGHYNLPYIPDIPGLIEYENKYPGSIRHSKHYRSVSEFQDKKVIVVGGSVSAFDALHEIRTVAQHPVISSLREPLAAFGQAPFTHPHIEVRPPIAKFDHETGRIDFTDGSFTTGVDIVLFATGYDFTFPFLQSIDIRNRRIQDLYQHVFNIHDPTLAFVGMVAGGFTFRVFEWQAVAIARLFAGRASLPPVAEMEKWQSDRLATSGDGIPFFTIQPGVDEYFELLRSLAREPKEGTTGRVLPKFEQWWADEFQKVVTARVGWWEQEMRKAKRQSQI